ncbi:MAG: hypothetical protein R2806_23685 [Saprospiraceae bacterium]
MEIMVSCWHLRLYSQTAGLGGTLWLGEHPDSGQRLDAPGTLKNDSGFVSLAGTGAHCKWRYPRYNQAPPEAIPAALRDRLKPISGLAVTLFDYLGYRLLWE